MRLINRNLYHSLPILQKELQNASVYPQVPILPEVFQAVLHKNGELNAGMYCGGLDMKYLKQFFIIILISFMGELLKELLPFPVPASINGMLINSYRDKHRF